MVMFIWFFGGYHNVLVRQTQSKGFKKICDRPLPKSKWPLRLRKSFEEEENEAQKSFREIINIYNFKSGCHQISAFYFFDCFVFCKLDKIGEK